MSELLSYYKLCPITSDVLGVSEDAESSSIICTLGQKIVYLMQVMSKHFHFFNFIIPKHVFLAQLSEAIEIMEHF